MLAALAWFLPSLPYVLFLFPDFALYTFITKNKSLFSILPQSVCMAESLHCSPKTITTLLVTYTPIQNVFGVKKNKKINQSCEGY